MRGKRRTQLVSLLLAFALLGSLPAPPIAAGGSPPDLADLTARTGQALVNLARNSLLAPFGLVAAPAPTSTHDYALSTPWTAFDGGVNVVGGNLARLDADLAIPSVGFPTVIARTYNSIAGDLVGAFGNGWSWSYGDRLTDGGAAVTLTRADWRSDTFTRNGDGSYSAPPGIHDVLRRAGDGTWTLTDAGQTVQAFDAAGLLVSIADENGNSLRIAYSAGRPATIIDAGGRTWTLTTDGAGRITRVTDPAARSTTYNYDGAGDLVRVTDAAGNATDFAYAGHLLTSVTDAKGNVTRIGWDGTRVSSITDAADKVTVFAYNTALARTTVTDPLGRSHSWDWDGTARLVRATDGLGGAESYAYDTANNRISTTDRNGRISRFEYDAAGNLTASVDAAAGRTELAYDAENHLLSRRDPLGRFNRYTYDAAGNQLSATDPAGAVTTSTYDAEGLLRSITDAAGRQTIFTYDAYANQLSARDPLNNLSSYEYDAAGRRTAEIDPDLRRSEHTYDALGRPLTTTDGEGNTTTLTYDAVGNLVRSRDPLGNITRFEYDARNLPTTVTDPLGNALTTTYDAAGQKISVRDALGNTTAFQYDAAGRLTRVTDANANATNYAYDAVGNQLSVTDALARTTRYRYDALNRLTGVTDAAGGTAAYEYDAVGNLTAITDPRNNTSRTVFDALDRPTSESNALGKTDGAGYDSAGQLVAKTDANGRSSTFAYDAGGRLSQAIYPEGTVNYEYDGAGHRVRMTDFGGSTSYRFDRAGRLVAATQARSTGAVVEVRYDYDRNGRLTRLTYPDGRAVNYVYDAAGHLIKVRDWDNREVSYGYDDAGRRTSVSQPNGTSATTSYDPAGRTRSIVWRNPANAIIARADYTYDAVGNIRSLVDTTGTSSFTYDALDRLTQAAYPDAATTSYAYDAAGNRTSMTVGGTTTTYDYDSANRMTRAGAETVTFDDAGNMTRKGTNEYLYDSQGRLIQVERAANTVQLSYDGNDRRITRSINGRVSSYTYDEHADLARVLREQGPFPAVDQVYGLDQGTLWAEDPEGGTLYFAQDQLGSTVAVSDATGALRNSPRYDAFGTPRGADHTLTSFWFAGEQYEPESGLIYLRARYYDPATGRFLSPDPVRGDLRNPQTLNPYTYATNNPLRFTDPSGRTSGDNVISTVLDAAGIAFATQACPLTSLLFDRECYQRNSSYFAGREDASVYDDTGALTSAVALIPVPVVAVVGGIAGAANDVATGNYMLRNGEVGYAALYYLSGAGGFASLGLSRYAKTLTRAWIEALGKAFDALDVAEYALPKLGSKSDPSRLAMTASIKQTMNHRPAGSGRGVASRPEPITTRYSEHWSGGWGRLLVQTLRGSTVIGGAYVPLGYIPPPGTGGPQGPGGTGSGGFGGVQLCADRNFGGHCVTYGLGEFRDLGPYGLDNNVESMRGTGYHVTLFWDKNLSGNPAHFVADGGGYREYTDLTSANNQASSMRVERSGSNACSLGSNGVALYRDTNFRTGGGCVFATGDIPDLSPLTFDVDIGSIQFFGNYYRNKMAVLYRQPNFQDECGRYWQGYSDLRVCADKAMSVRIIDFTPPPPVPIPPGTLYAGNVARAAHMSSGGGQMVDGDLQTTWEGSFRQYDSTVHFSWAGTVTINRIVVWDHTATNGGGTLNRLALAFSDGTMARDIDMIVQGPHCVDLTFLPKSVDWVQVIPQESAGLGIGYREVEIWATVGDQWSDLTCSNPVQVNPVADVVSPPPDVAVRRSGRAPAPLAHLVVSTLAAESSDGQSHDATNPYVIPVDASYDDVWIKTGAFASSTSWDGRAGGIVRFRATGRVLIDGVLEVDGDGYRGGPTFAGATAGRQGESFPGLGTQGAGNNGGGGGGGASPDGGGGGGGYGSAGQLPSNGSGVPALTIAGSTYGDATLTVLYMGSGGGSSGAQLFAGPGGAGGGIVSITADTIIVNGRISANGASGRTAGFACNPRGGGGGSGGSIKLVGGIVEIGEGRVSAVGGSGAPGMHDCDSSRPASGGNGGDGRIRVEYVTSVGGTSVPAASRARTSLGPIRHLVISTDAALSTDGESHGPSNPYVIPLDAEYESVTIGLGAFAAAPAWNGSTGGRIRFTVSGTARIDGTLTVTGLGYRGGGVSLGQLGVTGESIRGQGTTGYGHRSAAPNDGGGAGGQSPDAGGGGGGYGSSGQPAVNGTPNIALVRGGMPYGDEALASGAYLGSGGGSSGAQTELQQALGGNGGGAIEITAATLIVNGTIAADGSDGQSRGYPGNERGGGGGSGGSVFLQARILDIGTGRVTAVGGRGGFGVHDGRPDWPARGGDGGFGRIRIEYFDSVAGSTTPAASLTRMPDDPIADLVVSLDPARSSDGQSHSSSAPYFIPIDASYETVTIEAGSFATAGPWNGSTGGVVRFSAAGLVRIDGTLSMDLRGYRGGASVGGAAEGLQGESSTGPGGRARQRNGCGGGGGLVDTGAGGGGYGTAGQSAPNPGDQQPIDGGDAYGDAAISQLLLGCGGGSAGAQPEQMGGAGGNGGGAIKITAGSVVLTGRISVDGGDGGSAGYSGNERGGGGGSGGSVLLLANTLDIGSGLITARGGRGGYGIRDNSLTASGGNGGDGRIRIEYGTSFSGTTTPAASVEQLAVLAPFSFSLPTLTKSRTAPLAIDVPGGDGWIAGHLFSEDGSPPAAGDPRFTSSLPTSYALTGDDGPIMVYAWLKDAAGRISPRASASLVLDTTSPAITFSVPEQVTSPTFGIDLSATDSGGSGVTGYFVSESATAPDLTSASWTATAPTSYTFSGATGERTLYGYARDEAGNVRRATRSVTYGSSSGPDITPPVVQLPTIALTAAQTLSSTVRVHLSWPAAIDISGIDHYELQSRKGTGAWLAVTLATPTSTAADVAVAPNANYRFRLRAADGASNVGAWVTTPAAKLALLQETAGSITYTGSFKRSALTGSSGGYVRQTNINGRVARLSFTGRSAAFVTTLATARGQFEIRLDNGAWIAFDAYSSATVKKRVIWASGLLTAGSHTLDIRIKGLRNPSATANRVDIDAFLVWR